MRKNRYLWLATICAALGFVIQSCSNDDGSRSTVVPEIAQTEECAGDELFSTEQTMQVLIPEAELNGLIPGDLIVGMRFRLTDSAAIAYPVANSGGFTQFDVKIGRGPVNEMLSTTYALNFVDTPVTVRSGSRAFDAGAFPAGGAPNAFGPDIEFTASYPYAGGPLVVEIRSTQPTENFDIDACTLGDTSNGKSVYSTGAGAASDTMADFSFSQAMVMELLLF